MSNQFNNLSAESEMHTLARMDARELAVDNGRDFAREMDTQMREFWAGYEQWLDDTHKHIDFDR